MQDTQKRNFYGNYDYFRMNNGVCKLETGLLLWLYEYLDKILKKIANVFLLSIIFDTSCVYGSYTMTI